MLTLSTEQMFPYWLAWGKVLQGWALTEQGCYGQGIGQIQQGLADYHVTGAKLFGPYFLALLAEAYGKVEWTKDGFGVLGEALNTVNKTGERWYEAELYRLKGELTLQQWKVESQKSKVPNTQHLTPSTQAEAEVEACFQKAIAIAQKQQAKSLELRATTSLARLWQQQGKQHEARDILAAVYNWFTEGFDTKDLQEAKELLEELGG
jgi:predicted ATPase